MLDVVGGGAEPVPEGAPRPPSPPERKNLALWSIAFMTPDTADVTSTMPVLEEEDDEEEPTAAAPRRDTTEKLPVSCRSACTSSRARHGGALPLPDGPVGMAAMRTALWRRHVPTNVVGGRESCEGRHGEPEETHCHGYGGTLAAFTKLGP